MESMTGFGKGFLTRDTYTLFVLTKSLNHRYLEISLKLPKRYSFLEERIRKRIAEVLQRGKIEVQIKLYGFPKERKKMVLDIESARKIKENLEILKKELNLKGSLKLEDLLLFKENFLLEEEGEEDLEALWEEVEPALDIALRELKASRLREGELIKERIKEFFKELFTLTDKIEKLKEKIKKENIRKMKERVQDFIKTLSGTLDEGRLYQEIAFFLEKTDFTEELDRFKFHLKNAWDLIEAPSNGKKLDFLCQELYREINTLSNKAQNSEISQFSITIKDLIEKIREQVQNIV